MPQSLHRSDAKHRWLGYAWAWGAGVIGVGVGAGGREWVGPGWTRLAVRRLRSSLGGRRRRVGSGSLSPELPGPKISVFKKSFWILSICVNVQNPCKSARMHRGGGPQERPKNLKPFTHNIRSNSVSYISFTISEEYVLLDCYLLRSANTPVRNSNTGLYGPNTVLYGKHSPM